MGEFDEGEKTESRPFRVLVRSLMWLAISTRPNIYIAVPSAARDYSAPKAIPWKTALDTLAQWYFWFWPHISERGISRYLLRGFADADYASKATDKRSVSGGAINVWRCMCVSVFQDADVCHPFC